MLEIVKVRHFSDNLVIGQKREKMFGLSEKIESGVITYERLMNGIQNYLEPFESSVPGIKILKMENAEKIKDWFNSVKLGKVEGYRAVAPDGFVDVKT